MSSITVRDIPEETHRALKARAASNRRSTEAEVRAILEAAVRPAERIKAGTLLSELGRMYGELRTERDETPAKAVGLG